MSISVTPSIPVIAAQGVASDLVLQPGTVVDAEVLKLLADNLVRIAVAGFSIDVLSEIPLAAGQALQLAVSQTPEGIRLAVVGPGANAAAGTASDITATPSGIITPSPDARVDAAANPLVSVPPPRNQLTPLERLAVSVAAQGAATRQGSQAALFANLGSVGVSDSPAASSPAAAATAAKPPALPETPVASVADAAAPLHAAASPTPAPLSPEIDVQEILLPQARVPVADDAPEAGNPVRIVLADTLVNAGPRAAMVGAALNLLQEALQEIPRADNASLATVTLKDGRLDDVTVHTTTPPPPFCGALPSAQPVASPSIEPNMPLATTAHHLLSDTDAAIARQTLLQVASLPDRVDTAAGRLDPATPRWNFEIPFVTLQGTAMAQFEISRDGGGSEVEAAKRVWRARFSLDIEPAGPVHALVSLSGERTSVRMWAERPATAAQLRAGAVQLSQALSRAELQPGDIVIRDGTPPQPVPAPAGYFLDRAL